MSVGVTGWFAEILPGPGEATLALTGGDPDVHVTTDNYVYPESAVLTLTGERPGVNGPPVSPLPAEFALTGGTPSIGERVAPDDAELTLAGSTPAIVQTANNLLAPTGATASLTGSTPTILTGKILQPTGATPALTGGTPSLASRLVPTSAAPTLTGGRPLIHVTFPPPTAQLTLTGGRPLIDTRVVPAGATLALTGGTPTVTNIGVVSYISSAANASSSVTIPTHSVGDLIVLFAYNPYAIQAPTKPSASGTVPNWSYIDNADSGSGSGCTTAQFKATATNTTTGTWGNASHMIAVVIRAQNTSSPIGGHAQAAGSSGTTTAPSVTMTHTDGSSVLLHFHGHSNLGASGWDTAPAGYTRGAASGGAFGPATALNYKNITTSDGSVAQTGGQSSQNYAAATVEIIN